MKLFLLLVLVCVACAETTAECQVSKLTELAQCAAKHTKGNTYCDVQSATWACTVDLCGGIDSWSQNACELDKESQSKQNKQICDFSCKSFASSTAKVSLFALAFVFVAAMFH